jgi:hypothetical protein
MRSYILTSGSLFAALVAVHVWRLAVEGFVVVGNPFYTGSTLASAAMAAWAWYAFKRAPRTP